MCIVFLGNTVLGVNQILCVSHCRQDIGQPLGSRFGSRDVRYLGACTEVLLFLVVLEKKQSKGCFWAPMHKKGTRACETPVLLFHTSICICSNFPGGVIRERNRFPPLCSFQPEQTFWPRLKCDCLLFWKTWAKRMSAEIEKHYLFVSKWDKKSFIPHQNTHNVITPLVLIHKRTINRKTIRRFVIAIKKMSKCSNNLTLLGIKQRFSLPNVKLDTAVITVDWNVWQILTYFVIWRTSMV